jgi:hypothetical protein
VLGLHQPPTGYSSPSGTPFFRAVPSYRMMSSLSAQFHKDWARLTICRSQLARFLMYLKQSCGSAGIPSQQAREIRTYITDPESTSNDFTRCPYVPIHSLWPRFRPRVACSSSHWVLRSVSQYLLLLRWGFPTSIHPQRASVLLSRVSLAQLSPLVVLNLLDSGNRRSSPIV